MTCHRPLGQAGEEQDRGRQQHLDLRSVGPVEGGGVLPGEPSGAPGGTEAAGEQQGVSGAAGYGDPAAFDQPEGDEPDTDRSRAVTEIRRLLKLLYRQGFRAGPGGSP